MNVKIPNLNPNAIAALMVWTGAVVLVVTGLSIWYFLDRALHPEAEPAFVVDSVSVAKRIVEPGEPVTIRMRARRFHACPSVIAAFWLNDAGTPIVRFPPTTGGYTDVDPDGYEVTFNVPAPDFDTLTGVPAAPGLYHYKSTNAPLCEHLAPTETPDNIVVCLVVPGRPPPDCAKE